MNRPKRVVAAALAPAILLAAISAFRPPAGFANAPATKPADAPATKPAAVLPANIERGLTDLADAKAFFINAQFEPLLKDLPADQKAAVVARLKSALSAETLEVRRRAALLLHHLGDDAGVPVMIKDMADKDDRERGNVAVALRIMKDRRAIPALMKATDDPAPYVRSISLYALGEINAPEAYDKIVTRLADKQDEPWCMRMYPAGAACYALGSIGDRRALPKLIEVLDDNDLARNASQALAQITKTGKDWNAAQWKAWWAEQKK